jgi:hypothetical protein
MEGPIIATVVGGFLLSLLTAVKLHDNTPPPAAAATPLLSQSAARPSAIVVTKPLEYKVDNGKYQGVVNKVGELKDENDGIIPQFNKQYLYTKPADIEIPKLEEILEKMIEFRKKFHDNMSKIKELYTDIINESDVQYAELKQAAKDLNEDQDKKIKTLFSNTAEVEQKLNNLRDKRNAGGMEQPTRVEESNLDHSIPTLGSLFGMVQNALTDVYNMLARDAAGVVLSTQTLSPELKKEIQQIRLNIIQIIDGIDLDNPTRVDDVSKDIETVTRIMASNYTDETDTSVLKRILNDLTLISDVFKLRAAPLTDNIKIRLAQAQLKNATLQFEIEESKKHSL